MWRSRRLDLNGPSGCYGRADLLEVGFEYRLDSRLLIANPPDAVRESACPTCKTAYYFWDEEEQRLLAIPPEAWIGAAPLPPPARAGQR